MLRSAELKSAVDALKAKVVAARKPTPEIIVRRGLRLDDVSAAREKLSADNEAGATYFILDLGRYENESAFGDAVDTFMGKVTTRA